MTHLMELLMNFLRRFLLPPCLGFVAFGFRKHDFSLAARDVQLLDDEPCLGEGVEQFRTLKTGFHNCAQTLHHSLCQDGMALADHPQTICPTRTVGPAPDPDSAGESQPSLGERQRRSDLPPPPASTGTFKIWRKHSHTRAWCAACDSDNSGWTPFNHISSHADCTSGTTGMRSNNNFCSSDFSQNRRTNPGCPLECPKSSLPARPRPMLSSLSTQLSRV